MRSGAEPRGKAGSTGVRTRIAGVTATPFAWPLLAFALSAVWGRAIAADTARANSKLGLVALSLLVYVWLATVPEHLPSRRGRLPLLRAAIASVPATLAGYFLLVHDWGVPAAKAGWLDPLRALLAAIVPRAPWPALHPNVVGGVLAMWLPLQVAALAKRRREQGDGVGLGPGATGAVAFSVFALLMTGLRGAWLSLGLAVAVAAALAHRRRLRASAAGVGHSGRATTAAALAGAGIVLAAAAGAWWFGLRPDRWFVWETSLDLVRDYAFTGLGLSGFSMAYSSYVLMMHVPHTGHAHNLFLDLWLEQGPIGASTFVVLVIVALASATRPAPTVARDAPAPWPRWRTASMVALLVIVFHGLVDDVHYGYEGGGLPALLVPVALLSRRGQHAAASIRWRPYRSPAAVVAVAVALVCVTPYVRSAWQSNAGAVQQTRAELSTYDWPRWPVQDAVRRAISPHLAASLSRYESALRLNPSNAVAARRLGQVELSLGRYDDGRRHLEAAFGASPHVYATRQLLGEALAVTGDVAAAADLWHALGVPADRLAVRQWWYEHADPGQRAEWFRQAVALAVGNGDRRP